MKTTKLVIDYDYNFLVFGIITCIKEYKLAWSLNHLLNFELCKNIDLEYIFMKNASMKISNFVFETEYDCIRLLKNRVIESENIKKPFLLPECKEYDYFLHIEGDSDIEDEYLNIQEIIKSIEGIIYVSQIEVENLKSKDNLIF